MNDKMNIFYAATGAIVLIILSYNAVRTQTVEVVEIETEIVEVEVIKEVPVEVIKDRYIAECKSFDKAFKTHRELLGKHETFFWNDKEYNLYHKEEIKWEK